MPKLDFATSLMDLAAFALLTPEVLGEERFLSLFKTSGKLNLWFQTRWFGDGSPSNVSTIFLLAVCILTLVLIIAGVTVPERFGLLVMAGLVMLPAAFVLAYKGFANMARPMGVTRAFAMLGALLFVAARLINMAEAWGRM